MEYPPTYIISTEGEDFFIYINGLEVFGDLLEDLLGDKGAGIECRNSLVIDDHSIPFNLLNLSFEISKSVKVDVTLEYSNGSSEEIKASEKENFQNDIYRNNMS